MDGKTLKGLGEALNQAFQTGLILLCIFVPLGLWKIIEIIIWLVRHVKIGLR